MASATELTKLGFRARIQKLGSLKYILIASFLLLVLGTAEIWRYNEYGRCISTENAKAISMMNIKKPPGNDETDLTEKYFIYMFNTILDADRVLTDNEKEQKRQELIQPLTRSMAERICGHQYRHDVFRWFQWLDPISTAHAQMKIGAYSESDIRGIVIISIFGCMGMFFFISTGALLFSKNAKVVAFAMDSVKTLLGFFIGVAMTFMGVR